MPLMATKPSGSSPITWRPSVCHSASAYRIVPVPRVAMNESICATSTSMPLISPAMPPHSTTIRQASGQGTWYWTWRLIARMCHITMPKPIVRSMRPAIIGTIAASDSSAMIALSLRIERALIAVGNDSGSRSEKNAISSDREDRQTVDRQQADDRLAAAQRRQLRARRLERVRFQGLHRTPSGDLRRRWPTLRQAGSRRRDRRPRTPRRPVRDRRPARGGRPWRPLRSRSRR